MPLSPSSSTTRQPQSRPNIETLSFTSLDRLINELGALTRATDAQPGRVQGRAIAVAMVGTPLALSLGIPWPVSRSLEPWWTATCTG